MQGIFELPAVLFPAEILQRMDLGGGQVIMKKVRENLYNAMDVARGLLKPSGIVVTVPVKAGALSTEFPEEGVKVTNNEFAAWAMNYEEVSVYAVSLGSAMEERLKAPTANEAEGGVLNAVAADALEQAGSVLMERMIMEGVDKAYQVKQYRGLTSSDEDMELREAFLKVLAAKATKEGLDAAPFASDFALVSIAGNIPFDKLNW